MLCWCATDFQENRKDSHFLTDVGEGQSTTAFLCQIPRKRANSVGAAPRCRDVQQLPGSAAVLTTSEKGRALQPGPSPAGPGAVTLQGTLLGKGNVALLGLSVGWLGAGSLHCCTLQLLLALSSC